MKKISPQIQRVITGIVLVCLFVPVLWFSDTIVFPIVVSLLAGVASYELLSLKKAHHKFLLSVPTVLFSATATLFYGLIEYRTYSFSRFYFTLLAMYVIYMLFISVVRFGKVDFSDIAMSLFSAVLSSIAFTTFLFCRRMANLDYLLIIVAACFTDIFALYAGTLFGKHKLCPNLSPKKTVEGAIGGVVGCIVGFLLYGVLLSVIRDQNVNYVMLAVAAIPASVSAQFGDLSASSLKRYFGAKDYGKIFPGHGGVLDRFDSILAVSMAVFAFLRLYTYISQL